MKALAYANACEGAYSPEIEKLRRIERFGLEAITGRRVFLWREYCRMIYAENIVTAYRSRQDAANWAEWVESNPKLADMLNEAERLYDARIDSD